MDTFRNLFGNATATIFRLVVVAGTIILISIFIVKPALDTTEKAIEAGSNFGNTINRSTDPTQISRQIQRNINRTNRQVQRQIRRAQRRTARNGGATQQQLLNCIQRANQNAQKIAACAQRFN